MVHAEDIWTPLLQLNGIPQLDFDGLNQLTAVSVDHIHLWPNGTCTWQILYKAVFDCSFDIIDYPFDNHTCSLNFNSAMQNFDMVPHNLRDQITGSFTYDVYVPRNNGARVAVWTVHLKRKGAYTHL